MEIKFFFVSAVVTLILIYALSLANWFYYIFEVVWGGLLGSFGHTVFYPVNPNPPRPGYFNTPNPSLSDPTLSYKRGL